MVADNGLINASWIPRALPFGVLRVQFNNRVGETFKSSHVDVVVDGRGKGFPWVYCLTLTGAWQLRTPGVISAMASIWCTVVAKCLPSASVINQCLYLACSWIPPTSSIPRQSALKQDSVGCNGLKIFDNLEFARILYQSVGLGFEALTKLCSVFFKFHGEWMGWVFSTIDESSPTSTPCWI